MRQERSQSAHGQMLTAVAVHHNAQPGWQATQLGAGMGQPSATWRTQLLTESTAVAPVRMTRQSLNTRGRASPRERSESVHAQILTNVIVQEGPVRPAGHSIVHLPVHHPPHITAHGRHSRRTRSDRIIKPQVARPGSAARTR